MQNFIIVYIIIIVIVVINYYNITISLRKETIGLQKKNSIIKQTAKNKGIFLWEVADELGILDSNFSRKLRKELPTEEQNKILTIIEKLAKEKDRC